MNETPTHISRYEILDCLGGGWSGLSYRAVDPLLDRDVVVKLVTIEALVDGRTALDQFLDEAKAAARLQHRNIVTTFDYGEEHGIGFLVREYLRGQSLASRMRAAPPDVVEALDIIADVCSGLEFAHDCGVTHHDVKPAKVWLTNDGTVKLLDFGFVRSGASTLANYREFAGTVAYMAPELIAGGPADGRADVYSVGAILYELLTRRPAFEGDSAVEIMQRARTTEPRTFDSLGIKLPDGLEAIVMRALAKDPASRFESAADLALELQSIRLAIQPTAETMTLESPTMIGRLGALVDPADLAFERQTPVEPPRARRPIVLAVAGLIVIAVSAGAAMLMSKPPEVTPPAPPVPREIPIDLQTEAGATVFVNGQDVSLVTPARLSLLDGGTYVVRLVKAGFAPAEHLITAQDLQRGSIRLDLKRLPPVGPPVRVLITAPARSRYAFEIRDASNRTTLSAMAADHEIQVRPGQGVRLVNPEYFLDWTVPREVIATGQVSPPALGLLQIVVPEGASWGACTVWLDGRPFAAMFEQKPVASGRHAIQLKCDERTKVIPAPDVVDVEPGSRVTQKRVG